VLLYFGDQTEPQPEKMPDFTGLTHRQAIDTAGKLGLYIQLAGNTGLEQTVTVTAQSVEKNTLVMPGTTVRLTFADTRARD
jgi:beta-lactam-binding protein with PASTA domain